MAGEELRVLDFLKVFLIIFIFFIATETEGRRRMISKGFYHQLKNHEKQPLVGMYH